MGKTSIHAQIMEVDYELNMRRGVYPRRVASGKMKQAEADLHIGQLEAVLATLEFCRDHEDYLRAAATLRNQLTARRSALDLLENSLERHRADLAELVANGSNLDEVEGEFVPRTGTLCEEHLSACTELMALISDIEQIVGRPAHHPEPQWLDDLLDGKWSLS